MSQSPSDSEDTYEGRSSRNFPRTASADFQCFVCGAIFATDEDRKQHLEKEAHGNLQDNATREEMKIAQEQEEWDESHSHSI
jgi:uncharacterized C2H2 Zn-finger protein